MFSFKICMCVWVCWPTTQYNFKIVLVVSNSSENKKYVLPYGGFQGRWPTDRISYCEIFFILFSSYDQSLINFLSWKKLSQYNYRYIRQAEG